MSFPMLASKDLFPSSYCSPPVDTNQVAIVKPHIESVVVSFTPVIQVASVDSSQVSNVVSNIPVVPKSLLWAIGISGAIGVISYISMKYCPWWKNRMWKKRSTKSDERK